MLTEFGRRAAILTGTLAMGIMVINGVLQNSNLLVVILQGVAAALFFGFGGLVVGNMLQSYVLNAARREAARIAIQKELEKEMKKQMEEQAEKADEEIDES
ncbi:MAG TPA: hypothetical protein ENN67_01630 [Firmicutes bacterium]|nr:hypothetical protein [Bacillota bacterium]